MRRIKTLSTVVAAATLAMVGFGATNASAATSGATGATFALTAGAISITVPASTVALGTAAAGASSLSGSLGSVSVTDARGALPAVWTATVTSTPFTTGGATANETVAAAAIGYASGLVSSTGIGVFTGSGTVTPAAIGTGVAGVALTAGIGNNTASWNPTITFTLGASQVAGTYSGTITHSLT
jgi:hypothetical protein